MPPVPALDPERLSSRCDPGLFDFQTTADVQPGPQVLGQERAIDAIELAVGVAAPGYNVFVLGEPGSGRHHLVRELLERHAAGLAAPDDWCYVNNFAETSKPRLLRVPSGRGIKLAQDMDQFIDELARAIPAAFESDAHQARVDAINAAYKQREEQALRELGDAAAAEGVALLRSPQGFMFAPLKGEDAMSPHEFERLPDERKQHIAALIEAYGAKLTQLMQQLPRWRREAQSQVREASRETLALAAGHLIDELRERYADLPDVLTFLDAVMHDVQDVGESLREEARVEGGIGTLVMSGSVSTARYRVNPLVAASTAASAPVVYEDNPTHPNLVGRIDQVAQLGTLVTNFTLIKAGALHRANGGYLVLDAMKVLSQPYAWESLKRALRSQRLHTESLGQAFGLVGSAALEPEPMPLSLKVLLIGEPRVYYLLKELDPDFSDLFKVAAEFEDELPRDDGSMRAYAGLIAALAHNARLRPLEREAVARMVEYGARLCSDAQRLSLSRRQIVEVLLEADHCAARAEHAAISREDIEGALQARERRADRLRRQVHEQILRDTLLIAVAGGRVGQVNGLSVIALDDFAFAHPMRISATVRVGEGAVIDVEREAELGGAIHSKGVMILSAFLGARYARDLPLSLAASLVFEQSYGPVEGDSASLAELCALLSDLAGVPVRQALAVTGSVNQFGDVQPIGGVNEKIEGFFEICRARGLSGEQGVVIPQANVKHLMLRADVVDACAAGRFHVWAVSSVDEAIELLTGIPAGEPDAQGQVPEGTINFLVADQLAGLSAIRQAFSAPPARERRRRDKTSTTLPDGRTHRPKPGKA